MKDFYIYHNYIPKVGGIESAVFNLSKLLDLEGINVTVLFNSAESQDNLFHYAEVANVEKITPDTNIKCDTLLLASNHDVPKGVEAKKYLQWIHSDYDRYVLALKNIDLYKEGKLDYIAVSEHAKKVIERRENVKVKSVIYNLLDPDFGTDDRPILRLVSNTRVSPEKGFGRMLKLARILKEKGVRFSWVVYGDNSHQPREYQNWINEFRGIEEVQFVGFKSNVEIGLTNADYLVQLSDFEGCPYSVLEALRMKVPCIVTDWLGVDEIVEDGKNGYILDMELKNVDIDKIVNKIPEVKEKELSNIKDWIGLI